MMELFKERSSPLEIESGGQNPLFRIISGRTLAESQRPAEVEENSLWARPQPLGVSPTAAVRKGGHDRWRPFFQIVSQGFTSLK